MERSIFLIIFLLVSLQLVAQDFNVPQEPSLKNAEDYKNHEQDVINAINWLIENPINSEASKRKKINAFVMQWLEGSPYLSIELDEDIVTFLGCPDCLMVFLGGWTKYALEANDYQNNFKGNLAGIEALVQFYKKNKDDLGKLKAIEKYIKLQEKNKLEDFIKQSI